MITSNEDEFDFSLNNEITFIYKEIDDREREGKQ